MVRLVLLPVLGACLVALVLGLYVPSVKRILGSTGADFPLLTSRVLQAGDLVVRWWLPATVACVLLFAGVLLTHVVLTNVLLTNVLLTHVPMAARPCRSLAAALETLRRCESAVDPWNDLALRCSAVLTHLAVCAAVVVMALALRLPTYTISQAVVRHCERRSCQEERLAAGSRTRGRTFAGPTFPPARPRPGNNPSAARTPAARTASPPRSPAPAT